MVWTNPLLPLIKSGTSGIVTSSDVLGGLSSSLHDVLRFRAGGFRESAKRFVATLRRARGSTGEIGVGREHTGCMEAREGVGRWEA